VEDRSHQIDSNHIAQDSEFPKTQGKIRSDGNVTRSEKAAKYTREDSKKSPKRRGKVESETRCASQCAEHFRWVDIRRLIDACEELPPEARRQLIADGDEIVQRITTSC
jgi:hypothetical protein